MYIVTYKLHAVLVCKSCLFLSIEHRSVASQSAFKITAYPNVRDSHIFVPIGNYKKMLPGLVVTGIYFHFANSLSMRGPPTFEQDH